MKKFIKNILMKFLDFVFTKYEIEDKEIVERYNKLKGKIFR